MHQDTGRSARVSVAVVTVVVVVDTAAAVAVIDRLDLLKWVDADLVPYQSIGQNFGLMNR